MAKKAKVYTGTEWVDLAAATTDLSAYSTTAQTTSGFRNAIINGGFDVWQRGTSFTHTSGSFFTADRFGFFANGTGGTKVVSQQSFTPGAGSIPNFEPRFFWRFNQSVAPTSQTEIEVSHAIEDVRTFAGQTVTISFWAKADASRTVVTKFRQIFGTGGSSLVDSATQNNSVTTSWQRFTHTITVPSISGKTISATDSSLQLKFNFPVGVTQTIDIWGVQVEKGSTATPFEQRPIGTELALCQRYYYRNTAGNPYGILGNGWVYTSTTALIAVPLPIPMRTVPSSVGFSTLRIAEYLTANNVSAISVSTNFGNSSYCGLDVTTTGSSIVAGRTAFLQGNNSSSAYIELSAEL
jgi:hypothetical protein